MKVLLVITSLGVGGAEKVVTSLADQLVDLGHEVVIAYLTGEALTVPKHDCIRLVNLKVNSARGLGSGYLQLRKIIKEFKPDVVHSHLVHANILCRMLRPTTTIPRLISSAHNSNEEGRFRMLAYRLTDQLTDISTNVSYEAVEAFIEQNAVRKERMLTVHNGISICDFIFSDEKRIQIREELGIASNEKLILAVGRLDDSKDYPNLLSAVVDLFSNYDHVKLVIAGDGLLLNSLKEKTKLLGLEKKVTFLGVRTDIPSLMSAADIFVLSSAWEGFGLVVAEAMACNRVVVATDCGGVKEVVGDAGFLVPPKDPLALTNAIERALNLNADESIQLGKEARERVLEHYSLTAATEKWTNLYSAPINEIKTLVIDRVQR